MACHLAVMKPEILKRLLSGQKTIESRLTRNRCLPHGAVQPGDRILFKESGGPVRAVATASAVATWRLNGPEGVEALRRLYHRPVAAGEEFWQNKRNSLWATLIVLENIAAVEPFRVPKRDRSGWALLAGEPSELITYFSYPISR